MKLPVESNFYLVFHKDGRVPRCVKKQPDVEAGEVAVKLHVRIPGELFYHPVLKATIVVPDSEGLSQEIPVEMQNNIQEAIQKASGLIVHLKMEGPENV